MITNPATNTAKEQGTLPYGTVLDAETTASTNQKFTSYDRSDATGLDYAVNRIYSSEQARFLQPDPIGMASADLTDPQSLNLYTYARNNPIDLVDPSGLYSGYNGSNFRSLYAFFGSGIANLPGFGTEWGSMSDFYLAQYEERVDNAFSGRGFLTNEEYIEKEKGMPQDAGVIATVDVYWTNGSYEFDRWDFRDINLANLIRARAGDLASQQSEPGGDWRVRELVRGGAPTAKAARPALTAIATVMSFFTLPVAAAGSGVASNLVSKGTGQEVVKVSSFGQKLFLSERFGITSTKFGNSAAFAKGTMNQGGKLFKAGWSTGKNSAGQWGYKFRIGIGSSSANPNIARFHIYVPKSFVPNSFANPSIQVKRSLFKLGLKP